MQGQQRSETIRLKMMVVPSASDSRDMSAGAREDVVGLDREVAGRERELLGREVGRDAGLEDSCSCGTCAGAAVWGCVCCPRDPAGFCNTCCASSERSCTHVGNINSTNSRYDTNLLALSACRV